MLTFCDRRFWDVMLSVMNRLPTRPSSSVRNASYLACGSAKLTYPYFCELDSLSMRPSYPRTVVSTRRVRLGTSRVRIDAL